MKNSGLFQKVKIYAKVNAGGPPADEQLFAMAHDKYWMVLNTHLLIGVKQDKRLSDRVNAFKHALQTYGPNSDTHLPDLIQNTGKAKGAVFHGHVTNSNGTTYVLEWAVIDRPKRIMALIGFDTHENYKFQQAPLNTEECTRICVDPRNIKTMLYAAEKIQEAKNKFDRVTPHAP